MLLSATVHTKDGEVLAFEDVDYLSLVNGETFGKPPIIEGNEGISVLYVNVENIVAMVVEN
jgi:hypothetical protein